MNSVSEQIDERILRLLSLDDVFDLDYDTYMTLLKEAIVVGREKIPQEELALLANERKRIRGKKGRFKPKKEKITADKITTTKFLKPTKKTLALPESVSKPDDSQSSIGIGKPLQSISKTLASILKFNKKTNEEERKDKESQRRTKREEGLEGFKKGISAVSSAAKKMLAPFQSVIDRIWRFIFFTLLGRAFTQLMDWLGDPKNKKKIESLGRFLKDWWPSLAFAAGLFLTPFGKFIRTTIGALRTFIPQIATLLTNPVFLTVAGSAAAGAAGASLESNLKKVDETLLQRKVQESKDRGKPLSKQEIEKIKLNQLQKRIEDVRGTNIPGSALASGGVVPRFSMGGINFGTGYNGIDGNTGQKVSGFGPDTQAIIAQPGEIVINKKTVDAVGSEYFLGLNRQYGGPGANKPKMGKLYSTGGIVGMQGGGWMGDPSMVNPFRNPVKWYNLGRNVRIPNERSAGLMQLIRDDLQQVGKFKTPTGYKGFNPFWSFTKGLGTGPTPIQRQLVERGVPRLGMYQALSEIQGSTPQSGPAYQRAQKARGLATAKYAAKTGQFGRYQGGGEVMGSITPEEGLRGYEMARKKKELPTWMIEELGKEVYDAKYGPASTGGAGAWRYFKGSGVSNMRGEPLSRRGGGLIGEGTGMNIRGATADRQLAALQPGEYVLPVDTVSRLGTSLIDKLVALTDSNSNAAKLGKRSVNRPNITPLSRSGIGGMMTLPPITQPAGGSFGSGSAAGSKVPSFSAVSPSGGGERSMNASIYGIVG